MTDDERYNANAYSDEPPPPCCVCTGDDDAPPCGEDCDRIFRHVQAKRGIRGLYNACRKAMYMARLYAIELAPAEVAIDKRIAGCIETVRVYRRSIRVLREMGREEQGRDMDRAVSRLARTMAPPAGDVAA